MANGDSKQTHSERCAIALALVDMLADALINTDCTCSAGCNCGRQFALEAFQAWSNGTLRRDHLA